MPPDPFPQEGGQIPHIPLPQPPLLPYEGLSEDEIEDFLTWLFGPPAQVEKPVPTFG